MCEGLRWLPHFTGEETEACRQSEEAILAQGLYVHCPAEQHAAGEVGARAWGGARTLPSAWLGEGGWEGAGEAGPPLGLGPGLRIVDTSSVLSFTPCWPAAWGLWL